MHVCAQHGNSQTIHRTHFFYGGLGLGWSCRQFRGPRRSASAVPFGFAILELLREFSERLASCNTLGCWDLETPLKTSPEAQGLVELTGITALRPRERDLDFAILQKHLHCINNEVYSYSVCLVQKYHAFWARFGIPFRPTRVVTHYYYLDRAAPSM